MKHIIIDSMIPRVEKQRGMKSSIKKPEMANTQIIIIKIKNDLIEYLNKVIA